VSSPEGGLSSRSLTMHLMTLAGLFCKALAGETTLFWGLRIRHSWHGALGAGF
jgi:hypothetical protein